MTKAEWEALPSNLFVEDTARALALGGLTTATENVVRDLIRTGQLRAGKFGRRYVVSKREVERFLQTVAEPEESR